MGLKNRNDQVHIQTAIERSRSHNEIVTINWDADAIDDALDYIMSTYEGAVDYVHIGDVTEVWGWTDGQGKNEMDFRIHMLRHEYQS